MDVRVVRVDRYPVKGMRSIPTKYLWIDKQVGVVGDRKFGIRQRLAGGVRTWAPKTSFYAAATHAHMVAETPFFVVQDARRDLFGMPDLDPQFLIALRERLDVDGELVVQDTRGEYNLCNTDPQEAPTVSILNLATVRALESSLEGVPLDLRRFRMNIVIDGLPTFEELSWVSGFPGAREFAIGTVRFRAHDACERCAAVDVDPRTGRRDGLLGKPLMRLMESRGYRSPQRGTPLVMGILAEPLSSDRIAVGDPVRLI